MNDNTFYKNNKENGAKNLNTSYSKNEADRLAQKISSYNNRKQGNLHPNSAYTDQNLAKVSSPKNSTKDRINAAKRNNGFFHNSLANRSAINKSNDNLDSPVNNSEKQKGSNKTKRNSLRMRVLDRINNREEATEEIDDFTSQTFSISTKFLKMTLFLFLPLVLFLSVFSLLLSAPQVYYSAVGLGNADNVSSDEAEEKIMNLKEKDLNKEIEDEVSYNYGYLGSNLSNSLSFATSKLANSNLMLVDNYIGVDREFNEADLDELEDYYSEVTKFSDEYGFDMVYTFYFKLLYIQRYYKDNLNVRLDMPLLMATLYIQSADMGEIFSSNIKDYDVDSKSDNPYFDYNYDWSWYSPTVDDSSHDIELLAQHMVTKKDGTCGTVDGACYELDEDGYKEYLKEFLEKKYYLEPNSENYIPNQDTGDWRNWKQCTAQWANVHVPNSTKNICNIGCLITSVTIQIARSGTATTISNVNPGTAISKYSFIRGGNFVWASASNLAPNFKYRTKINLVGMSKESIAKKLKSYNPSKYYIILAVSRKTNNSISHYVALDYIDPTTNNIYMIDPGIDAVNATETYKLYAAHIYEKKD